MPRAEAYRLARALAREVADDPDLLTQVMPIVHKLNPCKHGRDFAAVVWFGKRYSFTRAQAAAVRLLWEAWEDGTCDVCKDTLMEEAVGSENRRIVDLFRDHPAWGVAIVEGDTKGTYRLKVENPEIHAKTP